MFIHGARLVQDHRDMLRLTFNPQQTFTEPHALGIAAIKKSYISILTNAPLRSAQCVLYSAKTIIWLACGTDLG